MLCNTPRVLRVVFIQLPFSSTILETLEISLLYGFLESPLAGYFVHFSVAFGNKKLDSFWKRVPTQTLLSFSNCAILKEREDCDIFLDLTQQSITDPETQWRG